MSMQGTPRKIADSYVATEIDDEVILLRLRDGEIFSLQGTSREIWACIDGVRTVGGIAKELSRRHTASHDTIADDVAEFIAELSDEGLVALA
jgi:pyrroloquinoline quinone biosynthesis protein D